MSGRADAWSRVQHLGQPPAGQTPGLEALDYAFRFASAIQADPGDKGEAQAAVVLDYASIGAIDAALKRVDEVEGWRRGVAYAELAGSLARTGRKEQARELLTRAGDFSKSITGWQEQRITAHIAEALALLGDVDSAQQIAAELAANDRQYAGRSVATFALGHASRGDFEGAMAVLGKLEREGDFDLTWWRTAGYLAVARQARLTRQQRQEALAAARRSADGIDGWKKAEALESIASELQSAGQPDEAREALKVADAIVTPLPGTLPVKAALLSNLARGWARLGETPHARELLDRATTEVPKTQAIEQPGLYADLASGYLKLGAEGEARRGYQRAITSAESLVNARPRALAAVATCRFMGRHGAALDPATRSRLDTLLSGLKEPW